MRQHQKLITIKLLAGAVIALMLPLIGQAGGQQAIAKAQAAPVERTAQQLYIIGSTLMKDYTVAVMEHLTKNAKLPPALIVNKGSDRGVEAFCAGIGLGTPDIVAVSRQIRLTELNNCIANGVKDIIAINIGYDANVLVSRHDDSSYPLNLMSLYRAIAAELPRDYNDFIPNQNKRWNEVDPSLPNTVIHLIIPAKGLGGRAFLEDRMLQAACRNISEIKTIFGADDRVKQCITMRSDGIISEVDLPYAENVVRVITTSPAGTIGIMPMHFAVINSEFLKIQPFEGVMPSVETVSNRQYQLIRPLYFFIKKAHIKDYWGKGLVSGLREFITEVTRESTIGPDGYLTEMGVVPVEEHKRNQIRQTSLRLGTIER